MFKANKVVHEECKARRQEYVGGVCQAGPALIWSEGRVGER